MSPYFPGTTFADGVFSYQLAECNDYWAFDYNINVTVVPPSWALGPSAGALFNASSVVIQNVGTAAGFDYSVTGICSSYPSMPQQEYGAGTLEPGDPPAVVYAPTDPFGMGLTCQQYYLDIHIHNRNWVNAADADIAINQSCAASNSAVGADICSGGRVYPYLNATSGTVPPGWQYVTGGCVSNAAANPTCDNSAPFCCPDGTAPVTTAPCADGLPGVGCTDCSGGCY